MNRKTKTVYTLTHPDGSTSTRASVKPVRFAVVRGPADADAWSRHHRQTADVHTAAARALERALEGAVYSLSPARPDADAGAADDYTTHRLTLEGAEGVSVATNRKGMAPTPEGSQTAAQALLRREVRDRVGYHLQEADRALERAQGAPAVTGWEVLRWSARRELAEAAAEREGQQWRDVGCPVRVAPVSVHTG